MKMSFVHDITNPPGQVVSPIPRNENERSSAESCVDTGFTPPRYLRDVIRKYNDELYPTSLSPQERSLYEQGRVASVAVENASSARYDALVKRLLMLCDQDKRANWQNGECWFSKEVRQIVSES